MARPTRGFRHGEKMRTFRQEVQCGGRRVAVVSVRLFPPSGSVVVTWDDSPMENRTLLLPPISAAGSADGGFGSLRIQYPEACFGLVVAGLAEAGLPASTQGSIL